MGNMEVGKRLTTNINRNGSGAPVLDRTAMISAGVVSFGVEPRRITTEVDRSTWTETPEDQRWSDSGITIHVFETNTMLEFLRFDCFGSDPHYHYNWPNGVLDARTEADRQPFHRVVVYDRFSHSPNMAEWAIATLRNRLRDMLGNTGGAFLCRELDEPVISAALDIVADEVDRLRPETLRR